MYINYVNKNAKDRIIDNKSINKAWQSKDWG